MSRVVFSKYAKQELDDAIRYYDLSYWVGKNEI
jgi:hypothetical protein